MRRVASIVLLVVAGISFPVLVLANWAGSTLYDSDTFSERAVEPLNSEAVREELARRLTAQLVQAGNQQATSFRPAFELALEGVIDTDTFKSIFRNAIRHTHESIIEQGDGGGRQGLDLGASFALITSSLQAGGGGDQQGASGLDNSLSDVTSKIDDLGLWDAEGIVGQISAAALVIGLAATVGSILLAEDRRRAVRRLGIAADRLVFPHAVTKAHETWRVVERDELHGSPALAAASRRALELAAAAADPELVESILLAHGLGLLLAGLTDQAVASQLDLSLRTVQRRLRHLQDVAGVKTRMQLGWYAAQHGWA